MPSPYGNGKTICNPIVTSNFFSFFMAGISLSDFGLGINVSGLIDKILTFGIIILTILIVSAMVFLSDRIFGLQSHAGKVGALIAKGDLGHILLIFKRKLVANYRLIKYSAWTKVLISILIVAPIMFVKPAGGLERIRDKKPNVWAAVIGITAGSSAALLLNDSGVIAASTSMLYAVVFVLFGLIVDKKEIMSSKIKS